MVIDLLNAHRLIRGETYVIILPEMETDCASLISSQLERISDDIEVRFVVLIGDVVIKNQGMVN